MASQKLLKKKLKHIEARLNTFDSYLTNFKNDYLQPGERSLPNDENLVAFEQRFNNIQKMLSEYTDVYYQIDFKSREDEDAQAEFTDFESRFYDLTSRANCIFSKFKPETKAKEVNTSNIKDVKLPTSSINQSLPVIPLPNFDGSYDGWLQFKSTFETLIHNNGDISLAVKFHYLRSAVKGPPAEVIQSIDFDPEYYETAWQLLCERYDNKKLLIHDHIKALVNLEPFTKESSTKLRKLVDDVSKHIRMLTKMEKPTQNWNSLLIYILTEKLDSTTLREWEYNQRNQNSMPKLDDFLQFLRNRANILETIEHKCKHSASTTKNKEQTRSIRTLLTVNDSCAYCQKNHLIYKCPEFLKLTSQERFESIKKKGLCSNCLRKGHISRDCKSQSSCRSCGLTHHTLLHFEREKPKVQQSNSSSTPVKEKAEENKVINESTYNGHVVTVGQILLSTAIVCVADKNKRLHKVRALLDSGSQSNFMTSDLCDRLKLNKMNTDVSVVGIGQTKSNISARCTTHVQTTRGDQNNESSFLIVSQIANMVPNVKIDPVKLNIPKNIKLADPKFYQPDKIDILLGAEHFYEYMFVGTISLGRNMPMLQKTCFGWVLSGPISKNLNNTVHCKMSQNSDISKQIEAFWKIEESPDDSKATLTTEELEGEEHFTQHTEQLQDGRFSVAIPFKQSPNLLGDSKEQARRRFLSLERKLHAKNELCEQYINFMREYEDLGHMTRIKEDEHEEDGYYIPHHAVLKESSSTTRLRVVFDASAKTTSGYSLNDIEMVGPTIQEDLLSILLNFRKHNYVITADVAKMYRQVNIKPKYRKYQRIFWRESPEDKMSCFKLNTVTYGTASAAFLAIRCLHKLADDNEEKLPKAAEVIRTCFYVDDLLAGGDSIEEVQLLKKEVTFILNQGKFELRKWATNDKCICKEEYKTNVSIPSEQGKTLGIIWNTREDTFNFTIKEGIPKGCITKRVILSRMAKIFDPLGLLAPIIIKFKIILQNIWKIKLSWDESVPMNIHSEWMNLMQDLPNISNMHIPRHVLMKNSKQIELHGFSDASTNAFGGCIYIKSTNEADEVSVQLLAAKSRVAPVKTLTIPKLELCGAVVLTKLMTKIMHAMNLNTSRIVFWSDSTIILSWIKMESNQFKTFVNHRVVDIQNATNAYEWRYVPSQENPADLLSRGVNPSKLNDSEMWWHGPSWLSKTEAFWPKKPEHKRDEELPEIRKNVTTLIAAEENLLYFPFKNFSKITRMERVMAYCRRFMKNCRLKIEERYLGPLSTKELTEASNMLIKIAQNESFLDVIAKLEQKENLTKADKLLNLSPFLDENKILRVGGRLENSVYS